jgi:uncharacterized membrane protein YgcG
MRSAILLLVLSAAILGSCTSAYKTGQTPDDVYYSPERYQDKYVNVKEDDNDRYQGDTYDDQYLRMKVHNRVMWSGLDDPYFYSPGYSYIPYYNWYNSWNPYTSWNYYYNPYYPPVMYTPKTVIAYNHPRIFNLNSYSPQSTNSTFTKGGLNNNNYNYGGKPVRIVGYTPSNNNSNSGAGNFLRNIFSGSSSNNSSSGNSNSSFSSGSRSSGGSSGSSGSSGGGGGGSAPVRRF